MPSPCARPLPARRLVPLRSVPCDHVHESTTRYDQGQKLLTFLLVCPVCRSERVVDIHPYEPRFQDDRPMRRAA
jgi:hypothetical protein